MSKIHILCHILLPKAHQGIFFTLILSQTEAVLALRGSKVLTWKYKIYWKYWKYWKYWRRKIKNTVLLVHGSKVLSVIYVVSSIAIQYQVFQTSILILHKVFLSDKWYQVIQSSILILHRVFLSDIKYNTARRKIWSPPYNLPKIDNVLYNQMWCSKHHFEHH